MSKLVPRTMIMTAVLITTAFMIGSVAASANEASQNNNTQSSAKTGSIAVSYTVQEGDNLCLIAHEHQITVRELMRANNLSGSLIRPGDVLQIPEALSYEGRLSRGDVPRDELMLLARLIHAEARGESFEGQVAVGAVILNRINSPYFPKTIPEVILQKNNRVYQFSPVEDGSINLEPDEKSLKAAEQALSGKDPTDGALFFYNPDISQDTWILTLPVVTKIGNHVFATCT
ncbi:MAG: cell wall hydrolase [Desulfotomaculaceae bacterium]|nr:cell wall hydrolase [Desulfotomaculaceae bacterium]